LRELYLLGDEVELVDDILAQQYEAMSKLHKVLDNNSFRITNHVRIDAFQNVEDPAAERLLARKKEMERNSKKLHNQIEKTAQVLRYNIEVAEEGDSKAVLVFTLVTIIFLPLSFVASLFGMNTADMRNLENNQSIFWAVALPLTALIGGLSLIVAYGGTQLRERFDHFRETLRKGRGNKPRKRTFIPSFSSRKGDEEAVGNASQALISLASGLKRRQTAKSNFAIPAKLARRDTEKKADHRTWASRRSESPIYMRDRPRKRNSRARSIVVRERTQAPSDDVVEVVEVERPVREKSRERTDAHRPGYP
jgi:hypothetical protein